MLSERAMHIGKDSLTRVIVSNTNGSNPLFFVEDKIILYRTSRIRLGLFIEYFPDRWREKGYNNYFICIRLRCLLYKLGFKNNNLYLSLSLSHSANSQRTASETMSLLHRRDMNPQSLARKVLALPLWPQRYPHF